MFVGNHFVNHKIKVIVIVIVICFILNIFVLKNSIPLKYFTRNKVLKNKAFTTKVYTWHRNNTPQKFCVWFNFTTPSSIPTANSITLCTHGSISYGKYVYDYAYNWKNSISASLIIDENGFTSLAAYKHLYDCDPLMKKYVTTHLVWEKTKTTPCDPKFVTNNMVILPSKYSLKSCNIGEYEKFSKHSLNIPYPPNTLRNIARHGASTKIHLIADIENQFSKSASNLLNLVSNKVTKNNVVAIRRFEYDENERKPDTTQILKDMLEKEKAYEFHHFLAKRSHSIENLDAWLNYSTDATNSVTIAPVKYVGSTWEPQLMVHSSHPYHFEGAPIRYADQQMLPYELCRANINFSVVSHVFSFHKGIKKSNTVEELEARNKSLPQGELMTKKFHKYLREKYTNSDHSCGGWPDIEKGFLTELAEKILNIFY